MLKPFFLYYITVYNSVGRTGSSSWTVWRSLQLWIRLMKAPKYSPEIFIAGWFSRWRHIIHIVEAELTIYMNSERKRYVCICLHRHTLPYLKHRLLQIAGVMINLYVFQRIVGGLCVWECFELWGSFVDLCVYVRIYFAFTCLHHNIISTYRLNDFPLVSLESVYCMTGWLCLCV